MILLNINTTESPIINQASIVIGKDPIAYVKVNGKTYFSNYQLENAAVNYYNSFQYEDGSAQMSYTSTSSTYGAFDKTGLPSSFPIKTTTSDNARSSQTLVGTLEKNDRDSFLFTDHISKKGQSSNIQITWKQGSSVTSDTYNVSYNESNGVNTQTRLKDRPILYSLIGKIHGSDSYAPYTIDFPSPVLIRTEGGSIVKFFDNTNFTTPSYWEKCTGKLTFVYNLIPNKTYYYQVYDSNNKVIQSIYGDIINYGVIKTEGQIRRLKFENIVNARDCGGWKTTDGNNRFRYNVLYRGAQLDYNKNGKPYGTYSVAINSTDDRTEFGKLGIKAEIDLRDVFYNNYGASKSLVPLDINGNALTRLEYYHLTGNTTDSYGGLHGDFEEFMYYLSKIITCARQGKPAYIHCQQGKDRTGTHVAILYALCGISDDGILKDYELSSFWGYNTYSRYQLLIINFDYSARPYSVAYSPSGTFQAFTETGDNVQEKVQNWFKANYTNELDSLASASGITLSSDTTEKKNQIVQFIQNTLLEPNSGEAGESTPSSNVSPTPTGLFVIKPFQPSTSSELLRKRESDYNVYKFYEFNVTVGDKVTLNQCGGHVYFIESTSGMTSTLDAATTDISSGWTSYTHVEIYDGSAYTHTVKQTGKLLIVMGTSRSESMNVVSADTPSESTNPYGLITFRGKYQLNSMGNAQLEGLTYKDPTYNEFQYWELSAHKGDVVRIKFQGAHLYSGFIESENGIINAIISDNVYYKYVQTTNYLRRKNASGSILTKVNAEDFMYAITNGKTSVYRPYGDTTVEVSYSERKYIYTHNVQTDCKLLLYAKPGDLTVNGSSGTNNVKIAIFINGQLIFGPNMTFELK